MHLTFDRLALLFLVLLCLGVILWMLLAVLMAWGILCPPRMSAGKAVYHLHRLSPGDLGLPFEEQPFTVRDARSGHKLYISGWWIPAKNETDRCVILLHGYADAKVGAIAWAPIFHDLNCNILAIDLRAHGESSGPFSTGGFYERDDVGQVIDQLLNLFPDQTRKLILFGASLGAAVASAVTVQREDIAALILESPYTDYEHAIATQIRLMGLPGGLLLQAAVACAERFSGAKFNQVRPVELLAKVRCPVLTIVGTDDELLSGGELQKIERVVKINPLFTFWLVEDADHMQAMAVDPIEYELRIREFLTASIV